MSGLKWFAGICVLGIGVGVLWYVLAPHATGLGSTAGVAYSAPDAPSATITAWYLALTGAAGLLTGIPIVALADKNTVGRAVAILLGGFAAACLCYAVGFVLGPDVLADQIRGSTKPVTVHAPFVLPSALLVLLWPATSALIGVVGLLLSVMLIAAPRTATS